VCVCVCVCVCVYICMYVVWVGGSGLIGWVTGRRRDVQCSSDKFRHQKADYAYANLILFLGHGLASMTSPPLIPLQYSPDPSAASPVTLPQVGIRTLLHQNFTTSNYYDNYNSRAFRTSGSLRRMKAAIDFYCRIIRII
jgi:hypothetical protein